jgi:integrase
VQAWLGHEDLRLTMNTYAHADAQDAEQAAKSIVRLVPHQTHIA